MAVSEGELIKAASRPEVFLIENQVRRWIPDPETFESQWNWNQIRELPDEEVDQIPLGTQYPSVHNVLDGQAADNAVIGSQDLRLTIENYLQWTIGAHQGVGPVLPRAGWTDNDERAKYDLKNKRTQVFLQWERQPFGINLGWTDDGSDATAVRVRRWFFTRPENDASPIRYGETIALGNGKRPSFLKYGDRDTGINLHYSDQPVFEWRILGGSPGAPVNTGELLAFYNEKEGDCFIYFDRTVGGDIGWPSSKTWTDQFLRRAWSFAKDKALSQIGLR